MVLHLFRQFNVEEDRIHTHAHRWWLGDELYAHIVSRKTSPR